jgi:predicted lipoprotein with Yx(FWY)xxD motif
LNSSEGGPGPSRRQLSVALGAALTGAVIVGAVSVALASTSTVQTAKSSVTNQSTHKTTTETIVVDSKGFALYALSGDSKTHHECTKVNNCYTIWPPATVTAGTHVTKGAGVPGTLTTWSHGGMDQLVLSGHPLYRYVGDAKPHVAMGDAFTSFGGTWYVFKASKSGGGSGGGGWG